MVSLTTAFGPPNNLFQSFFIILVSSVHPAPRQLREACKSGKDRLQKHPTRGAILRALEPILNHLV
jgi:hypothetical protein